MLDDLVSHGASLAWPREHPRGDPVTARFEYAWRDSVIRRMRGGPLTIHER